MANEFRHKDVGSNLSQSEWEAIGGHIFNSQATGDIVYASSSTQLSRLAKDAANTVLVMGASIPGWSATLAGLTLTSPTINGTIATTGLTMPAFTMGGVLNVNNQNLTSVKFVYSDSSNVLDLYGRRQSTGSNFRIYTTGVSPGFADTLRLEIRGGVATDAIVFWQDTKQHGLKLGDALILNGQAFDAGSGNALINTTGGRVGLAITTTSSGNTGATLKFDQDSSSPLAGDFFMIQDYYARNSVDAAFRYAIFDAKLININDGSEEALFGWTLAVGGATNIAMTLSGAGALWTDTTIDCDDGYKVGGVAGIDESSGGTINTFTITITKGIVTAFNKVS